MELRGSADPSSHSSTGSGSLGGNDEGASPRVPLARFLSIDSFLDSVSTGVAGGTPEPLRSRSALHSVEPLDLVAEEAVSSGVPVPGQLFSPEPEPEPEPRIPAPPVPPRPPRSQSRAAALAQARPPSGSVNSSSDGSDDSGSRPEPGGAVFDVTLEVCRAAWFFQHRKRSRAELCIRAGEQHWPDGGCDGNPAVSTQENHHFVVRRPNSQNGTVLAARCLPV